MIIGLIPARGGSKRIPRKNIRSFFGKPIIAYSIEAALDCSHIDRVIVSTDDVEIAEIAKAAGAEVPFQRRAELADDHATTLDVIRDALAYTDNSREDVHAICCLYATAPFVTARDLADGYTELERSGADYVFAATAFPYPIQRALRIAGNRAQMFWPEHTYTRSQDLEPAYHDAGQFYWCRPAAVRAGKPLLGPDSAMYVMPRERVQDIDTLEDWKIAERLYRLQQDERNNGS